MGLWSSGSRHTSRKSRQDRESTVSSRRRERRVDDELVEVRQPDKDELRRRRESYYSDPIAARKRASVSAASKTASKRTSSTARRSSDGASRRHRRRHSTGSVKPERRLSESERRTEDYVYGPRPSEERRRKSVERAQDDYEESWSARRRSKPSPPSRGYSLSTVLETEVTPDDSISQVAERSINRSPERSPERVAERAPSVRRRQGAFVRSSLKRSNTTSSRLAPVAEVSVEAPSTTTSRRSSRNEYLSHQSSTRRHSTTSIPTKPELVECLTCGSDDIPSNKSAKLPCEHRMCHDCLKRIFEMSVKDPAHMPPKCCTAQHIDLKHVDKIFDVKFKELWNRKYHEYNTKNRIYCPTLKCGEWIRPIHIKMVQGRKVANCPRCKTKVCTLCNNKMHKSTECPKDPEIAKLVEQAKNEGWQRCYSCSALVERKEGCNHMTCRCTAEFCILCGSKWKTCECPWFNYAHLPDPDRLNNMRVPEPIRFIYQQVFGAAERAGVVQPPPMGVGDVAQAPGLDANRNARRRPAPEVTYQQEMDDRRRQERLDADLARRLQLASLIDPDDDGNGRRHQNAAPMGLGNVAGHFLNDDFVQNAANVVMDALGNADVGRRGERQSGRRRRAREHRRNEDNPGLAQDAFGDESVLGIGPAPRYR